MGSEMCIRDRITAVREWLTKCMGFELPPDDLPQLLQDGHLLLRLATAVVPDITRLDSSAGGKRAPGGSSDRTPRDAMCLTGARQRLDLFVAASRYLGVPESDLLVPEALLYPEPHLPVSHGIVLALESFAQVAAARGMLPPLDPA